MPQGRLLLTNPGAAGVLAVWREIEVIEFPCARATEAVRGDEGVMVMNRRLQEGFEQAPFAVRLGVRASHLDRELTLAYSVLGRGGDALTGGGARYAPRARGARFPSRRPCIRTRSGTDAHAS